MKAEIEIQKFIYNSYKKKVDEYHKIMDCKHKWTKYGWGYICQRCFHYTGTNDKLNKPIEKLLKQK